MTEEVLVAEHEKEPDLLQNVIMAIVAYYGKSEDVLKIPDQHYVSFEIKMQKLPGGRYNVHQPNITHLIPKEDQPRIITSH